MIFRRRSVAGVEDFAVMRESVEKSCGHRAIAEDAGPFAKGEIGRDDDRSPFVEAA